MILIEPQWNVEVPLISMFAASNEILIEPQWNVEEVMTVNKLVPHWILIEPQWNVEVETAHTVALNKPDFNRTIVECRVTPNISTSRQI